MTARKSLRERLFSRLIIDPDTGCLLWTGARNNFGYGYIVVNGKHKRVHRVMFEMFDGPVPDGLVLDHLCRVRHCANVDHLEPVTNRENIRRGLTGRVTGETGPRPFRTRRRKTHCKRGHEFTEANTYWTSVGGRTCRACDRLRSGYPGAPRAKRTHCPQGHPYDDENTYRYPDGRRRCRICQRGHRQAHKERRLAA